MIDYIKLNKFAYDSLAEEYFERLTKYDIYYRIVGEKICEAIFETAILKEKVKANCKLNVLELGCGPGAILQALRRYPCVKAYAIDFSEKMSYFARKSNSEAIVKVQNVLDIKNIDNTFEKPLQGNVDILIMAAFIHLFPRNDAEMILIKIKEWLADDGVVYLDTTEEDCYCDGEIRAKKTVGREEIKHLRTQWTPKDFNQFVSDCGYKIISQKKHLANNGKLWLRTIMQMG